MISSNEKPKKGQMNMLNRKIPLKSWDHAILVVTTIITISGCAPALVPTNYNILSPTLRSDRIPLKAGLYLSAKFKKAALIGNKGGRDSVILIGESLAAGATRTIPLAFEDMVILESSDSKNNKGINVIITPEIVDLENVLVGFPPMSKWESRLSCKWTIKNLDGDVVYLNTIIGEGRYKAFTTAFTYRNRLAQSMLPAIQDHYEKLLADLLARHWWEAR